MPDAHANFAYSTVATAPSPAASGTSLVVTTGEGARFPTPPWNATIWPANTIPLTSNAEIVRVTAISGDTLTITRAQESSTARSVLVSDQIAATITKKTLTDIETDVAAKADANHNHDASYSAIGHNHDHGALTDLSADDHTIYALLAGRAGGQTLIGGTAANEDLTLNGTSHATKTSSYVIVQPDGGNVGVGESAPAAKTHVVATTEQLRLGYDATNYASFTVSSAGVLTIDPTGDTCAIDGNVSTNGVNGRWIGRDSSCHILFSSTGIAFEPGSGNVLTVNDPLYVDTNATDHMRIGSKTSIDALTKAFCLTIRNSNQTTTGIIIVYDQSAEVWRINHDGAVRQKNIATPAAPPADTFQIHAADQAAGNSCPHVTTENGGVIKIYQEAAIADADGTLASVNTQLNLLLAALRSKGDIAT